MLSLSFCPLSYALPLTRSLSLLCRSRKRSAQACPQILAYLSSPACRLSLSPFSCCASLFFFTFFASSSHLWPLQSEKARTEHTSSYCTTRCPPFPPSTVYSIFRRIASRTYLYKHIPCRRILLNIFSRFALLGRRQAANQPTHRQTHSHTHTLSYSLT